MAKTKISRPVLWMVRRPEGLVPATQFDAEQLDRYKIGSRVSVTVEQPKNEARLRLYWALMGKVSAGIGMSSRGLSNKLLNATGRFKEEACWDTTVTRIPEDIKEMDEKDFAEYFDEAVEIITTVICPGATTNELMDGLYDYARVLEP